jgi:hypothetical protein
MAARPPGQLGLHSQTWWDVRPSAQGDTIQRHGPRSRRTGIAAASPTAACGRIERPAEVHAGRAAGAAAARGMSATRSRRSSVDYRYAEQEGLIATSPAAHVRRPRLDYESHATGLDRNEVGAMLVAAGLASARDHALISLLALNGLRVSEAIGAEIEDLGLERGHRTLTILRKGGKVVIVPSRPARPGPSIWPSANAAKARSSSERTGDGSIDTRRDGSCAASPGGLESPSAWDPTPSATPSSPLRWTPVFRSATCKMPPATPTPVPPCAATGRECPSTARHLHRRHVPRRCQPLTPSARSGTRKRSRATLLCVVKGRRRMLAHQCWATRGEGTLLLGQGGRRGWR